MRCRAVSRIALVCAAALAVAACKNSTAVFQDQNEGGWFSKPMDVFAKPSWAVSAIDDNNTQLSPRGPVAPEELVGADGRDSWVRERAGLQARVTPYGEMGVVANFVCARPHRGVARQWFRDDGVLAWLPLAGEITKVGATHRISMVWSTPDAHARELLGLSAQALCERVATAGGQALGDFQLLTAAAAFPLSLLRVPRTVAPRLALIGDAAHGIHPLSGHGVNLGYQDACALADLLAGTPEWQDIGSERLLRRYQRARREETVLVQYTTDALRRLFRAQLPGLKPLRNMGMNLSDGLPVIKNLLVRYALGSF